MDCDDDFIVHDMEEESKEEHKKRKKKRKKKRTNKPVRKVKKISSDSDSSTRIYNCTTDEETETVETPVLVTNKVRKGKKLESDSESASDLSDHRSSSSVCRFTICM